ncbi:ABC transporter permease [Paenibacillus sp. P22]|uniref:ABC transporter permease n=1 Tax=Paenibacillus sp. P22 TaxID=483908 RepID=UPI00038FDC75|nr:ABC transporter permease [Paenibacillus sp. P22]
MSRLFDFGNLVLNENMKIYRRARVWIMWGLMVLAVAAVSGIAYSSSANPPSMWQMVAIEMIVMMPLVSIFAVIVAADIVAGEFTAGTIKLLLIRPWSRSKILLSKYAATLLFGFFSMALLYAALLLVNIIFFGYEKGIKAAEVFGAADPAMSAWSYFNQSFFMQFISLIVTVTLAFMISSVFRSGALAIGLSLFVVLMGKTLGQLFGLIDRKWVDYVLFQHLDLTRYIGIGSSGANGGMTLGFSLAVLAGYYVIFMALSWFVFTRRDVAA